MPSTIHADLVMIGLDQLILGFAVDGADSSRILAVGGQRGDVTLLSEDGGDSWERLASPGKGLRGGFVDGDVILVCGEYGFLARSDDGGATWVTADTGFSGCLFGVTRDTSVDGGGYFVAGDAGYVAHSADGRVWKRVKNNNTSLGRMMATPMGVLIATDAPGDILVARSKPKPELNTLTVQAGADLMTATVTPAGTIVAVGARGGVFRSTDQGASFTKINVNTTTLLCGVCATADGRVVVCGIENVYVSDDDGASFVAYDTSCNAALWWCIAVGNDVFFGGEDGIILRWRASGARGVASSTQQVERRDGIIVDDALRAMVRPWRGAQVGVSVNASPPLPDFETAWSAARSQLWTAYQFSAAYKKERPKPWSMAVGSVAAERRFAALMMADRHPHALSRDDARAIAAAASSKDLYSPAGDALHDAVADLVVVAVGVVDAVAIAINAITELPYTGAGIFGRLRERVVTASDDDYAAILAAAPGLVQMDSRRDNDRRLADVRCAMSFLLPPGERPHEVELSLLNTVRPTIGRFGNSGVARAMVLASADEEGIARFLDAQEEPRHELFAGGERPYIATALMRGSATLKARLAKSMPRYASNGVAWASLLAHVDSDQTIATLTEVRRGKYGRVGAVGLMMAARLQPERLGADAGPLAACALPRPLSTTRMLAGFSAVPTYTPPPALSPKTLPSTGPLSSLSLPPALCFKDDEAEVADADAPYDGHWRYQPDGGAHVGALLKNIGAQDADAYVALRECFQVPSESAHFVLLPKRLHPRLMALGISPEGRDRHWPRALRVGGTELLPAFRAFIDNDATDVDERLQAALPVADVAIEGLVARAFAGKKHKALARTWALRHPRYAIAGALAAVADDANAGATASLDEHVRLLRFLDGQGHRDAIVELAGGVSLPFADRVTALLDDDPLTAPGAKLPALPPWAQPQSLPPLLTSTGDAADVAATLGLLHRVASSNADEVHAAIPQAKRRYTSQSLSALSARLFEAWQAGGYDPKHTFAWCNPSPSWGAACIASATTKRWRCRRSASRVERCRRPRLFLASKAKATAATTSSTAAPSAPTSKTSAACASSSTTTAMSAWGTSRRQSPSPSKR
jgi:photosystem II stability/assembly factor-like uncharacterized protein